MTRMTIGEALDRAADADPDAPAVTAADGALTRRELAQASRQAARLLIDRGVQTDDLVTLRLANSAEFVVAACAIWRAGATPQPLSPRLSVTEQRAIVAIADPRVVIGGDALDFPDRVVLTDLRDAGQRPDGPMPYRAAAHWKAPTSSGSTGLPKIVLATGSAHIDPDAPVASFLPLAARQLVVGPLTHSAPFTYAFRGLMTGHSLVVLPRFDAQQVLDSIAGARITWVLLVPTMLHRIMRLPETARSAADLSSIEQVVHIGAPIAPELKRAWLDWLGPTRMTEVYAGTESNGLTVIRGDEWLCHPGSVGRAAPGSQMRVVRPDGSIADPDETGRVQMRRDAGPASSYLGAETLTDDGWDSLGDDGHLDREGYLYLADRGGDRITRAGTSLYPIEVEQALELHAQVRSAVVIGVPDDELGQRIHAVVDVDAAAVDASDLAAWLSTRLDPEKRPDSIRVVREPLRDDAGKVRRREWAERSSSASGSCE